MLRRTIYEPLCGSSCQLGITIACVFAGILGIGLSLSYWRDHGLLSTVNKQTFDQIGNMIVAPFAAVLIYLSLRIGARKIERRDFSIYGATLSLTWAKQFVMGFALSAGFMTFIFAVEYFAGWIRIEGHFDVTQPGNVLSVSLLYSLVKVVIVGICEELVFRGLVLRNFVEGFSGLGGLGVTTSKALVSWLSLKWRSDVLR